MVLYFSATGNTAYIAKEIARRLDDSCLNLLDRIRSGEHSELHSDKPFIICAPVYVCEMPRFLSSYLKKQAFSGSRDVYFVFTSGGYCGISGVLAKSMFKKKNMNYMGHAEFRMPRNYVASDAYPMLSEEQIRDRLTNAYILLDPVTANIREGKALTARHVYWFETVITLPFNPVWSRFRYKTKDFFTTEKCISCGKCARLCPLNNISLAEGKPVWGSQCSHCMACIGNCPTEAIEYGNITQSKEKYNLGKYAHILQSLSDQE
ncbi:MAG: EFR1 family ferrodoxin [Clostridia bacterium]|nr:EFR1 family ferrodoxin [Clostridia bacterium]